MFYSTGGNSFHWTFLFSHSKVSDANICIIANFVSLRKTLIDYILSFISEPMEEKRMALFIFKLLQHFFKIST